MLYLSLMSEPIDTPAGSQGGPIEGHSEATKGPRNDGDGPAFSYIRSLLQPVQENPLMTEDDAWLENRVETYAAFKYGIVRDRAAPPRAWLLPLATVCVDRLLVATDLDEEGKAARSLIGTYLNDFFDQKPDPSVPLSEEEQRLRQAHARFLQELDEEMENTPKKRSLLTDRANDASPKGTERER